MDLFLKWAKPLALGLCLLPLSSLAAPAEPDLSPIKEADQNILVGGCTTSYWRATSKTMEPIFVENSIDTGAVGVVRPQGRLIKMSLLSSKGNDKHLKRQFVEPHHEIMIDIDARVTKLHPETDSTEMRGVMRLTWHKKAYDIKIGGATAC
jgi:hypothetical protein